jgi:16S rRNA (cytosine967-C5)-methyltransferase
VIAPARQASFDILSQIETRAAFSDYLLNSARVAAMSPRDRNLTREIVYGTLRWQGLIDHVIMKTSSRPDLDPGVRILLRLSVYQMLYMDRVPHHAVVHDAVEISKRQLRSGTPGFINGVLRRLSKERPRAGGAFEQDFPPWVRGSLPSWLWYRWKARFGEARANEYALSLNRPPRLALRLTGGVIGRENLIAYGHLSELVPGAFLIDDEAPGPSPDISLEAQDEASQLIPHLLGSIAGWNVWDACAAPGGKTAILSSMCGREGSVTATDIHLTRARRLRGVLERTGGGDVVVADARLSPPFQKRFDAVLADVPCSGLGTLRRNPEIKWRFNPDQLGSLRLTQEQILASASEAVRAGGLLIYSTCSTEPEENEQVVHAFLRTHAEFRLRRPSSPPGIESWLSSDDMLRTFPGARLWDGFFAALLVREG